jgi:ribose-phosphate pyrophosphokinase
MGRHTVELVTKKRLTIVAGRVNRELAEEVAERLGLGLAPIQIAEFANGELHCKYGESIRGADLFIFQSHASDGTMSVNDALMEHLIMVDAAKRASAKRITVVAPFYGYGRQDRKAEGREPITAKLLANMFEVAGAKRIVSVDLHSGQIQGFFDGPVDHLTAMPVLVDWMAQNLGDDLVVVSPDAGRVKVAERYANQLHADLAIVHKRRVKGAKNQVEAKEVVGEVEGRTCVLIDDMIDTAGTICAAAEQLVERGASAVYCAATHGVFSGPAIDRLKNSPIEKVVITNTLPLPPEKRIDKIEVLSAAGIIADAIDAVFEDTSVSEIFDGQNQS